MVSTPSSPLSPASISQQLEQLAELHSINTWCLAYSGGVDSEVLLHLLKSTSLEVYAVYIDHGLQAESAQWEKHCERQCAQYQIPFQCIAVKAAAQKGESPEAAARTARYAAFAKIIDTHTCLLTAQHLQDQAETVLLQLMRGAGAAGLSAMPYLQRFADGWHCRPLIQISQQAILDYAQQHQLSWVEDPSNQHQGYDRNFLRHAVMPQLQQRWPASDRTLAGFAAQQAENQRLLQQLAEIDLSNIQQPDQSLLIPGLLSLADDRRRNALRFWLSRQGASMPSRAVLEQLLLQATQASHDNQSRVNWAGSEVRRFRDRLYYTTRLEHDPAQVIGFSPQQWPFELALPSLGKTLAVTPCETAASRPYVLDPGRLDASLSVRFRQGGERIKPAGREGHRELKKLFQEADVPGWQRSRIPLLYSGEDLVAVIGYWLADEYAVKGSGVYPQLV